METCSQFANSLRAGPTITENCPTEQPLTLVEEHQYTDSWTDLDKASSSKSDIGTNSLQPEPTLPAKVFDFTNEQYDGAKFVPIETKQEHRQSIDVEAKFGKALTTFEQDRQQRFDPVRTVNFKEEKRVERRKISSEARNKKYITRSKSENSVKGIKRFKISHIFTRKTRGKLRKDKNEEIIPAEVPAWDHYGLGYSKRERSSTNTESLGILKSIGSKDGFLIESDIKDRSPTERVMNEWSSIETLKNDHEQASVQSLISSLNKKNRFIKQLEEENAALNVEKIDLMNALSNIWIEMEDLKNKAEEEKSDKRNSLGGFSVNKPLLNECEVNNCNGVSSDISKQEQSNVESMRSQINQLNDINEGLLYEKNMHSNTIKSLQNKLSALTEEREILSHQIESLLEKNKALQENTYICENRKEKTKVLKLKEENVALKIRLDNLQNARILAEKSQQRKQIVSKKFKNYQVKMEKRCTTLIEKIEEELQSSEKVLPMDTMKKGQFDFLDVPIVRLTERRMPDSIASAEFESLSDSESYQRKNSVKRMAKAIERSRSIELSALDQGEEGRKLWMNGIRRSVTISSLSSDKSLSSESKQFLSTKVSRFPPTHLLGTGRSRSDTLKSENVGLLQTKKKTADMEKTKILLNLETSCFKLLENHKELKRILENGIAVKTAKENISTQTKDESSPRKQSESVLYLCLMNLQKENDALKLDNLNLNAKVDEMHSKYNKQVVDKNSTQQMSHIMAGHEFGLFDSFINERLSTADGRTTDRDKRTFIDVIDGVQLDKHEELDMDVSSWHLKHPEKKSRDRCMKGLMKEKDHELGDNHEFVVEQSLSRTRASSLDRGVISTQQSLLQKEAREKYESAARNDSTVSELNVLDSHNSIVVKCRGSQTAAVHESACRSILTHPGEFEIHKNSPAKRSHSEIKAVRKALSTCRSRERLVTVYYV